MSMYPSGIVGMACNPGAGEWSVEDRDGNTISERASETSARSAAATYAKRTGQSAYLFAPGAATAEEIAPE